VLLLIPQIKAGSWYDASGRRKIVTQYHEVIGFFLGRKVQVRATGGPRERRVRGVPSLPRDHRTSALS